MNQTGVQNDIESALLITEDPRKIWMLENDLVEFQVDSKNPKSHHISLKKVWWKWSRQKS